MAIGGCKLCRLEGHTQTSCPLRVELTILSAFIGGEVTTNLDHENANVFLENIDYLTKLIAPGKCPYCFSNKHSYEECLSLFMKHTRLTINEIAKATHIPSFWLHNMLQGDLLLPDYWHDWRQFIHTIIDTI